MAFMTQEEYDKLREFGIKQDATLEYINSHSDEFDRFKIDRFIEQYERGVRQVTVVNDTFPNCPNCGTPLYSPIITMFGNRYCCNKCGYDDSSKTIHPSKIVDHLNILLPTGGL